VEEESLLFYYYLGMTVSLVQSGAVVDVPLAGGSDLSGNNSQDLTNISVYSYTMLTVLN
jgi:hypothetical protein